MKSLVGKIGRLLDVPSTDPDDARRRKLLNILLVGVGAIGLLGLIATVSVDLAGLEWAGQDRTTAYLGTAVTLFGVLIVFLINRYGPGWLASLMMLLFLVLVSAVADEPAEVTDGRGLLTFAIPIMMASVILPPHASFILAGVSSLAIIVIKLGFLEGVPNPFAILTFFMLAMVSWLAATTMERALHDLRVLNEELDQRVERRTQEVAQALSEKTAILEGIADGVIMFDTQGQAIVANPAVTDLLGIPPEEIVGCEVQALMEDVVDPRSRELLENLLNSTELNRASVKIVWGEKTLSASIAPVQVTPDEIIGRVAVFRDFTREAEVDRMKSTFVSIASHELRTPLGAIMGYADMLQQGVYGPLTDRQRSTLERIVANIGRLLSLVGNLLDQAQIEAGTLQLNVGPFPATGLVSDVINVMDVLAQSKGLELTSHVDDDVASILFGDRQRLHQVLVNLVGNAIKYTQTGEVGVRLYCPDGSHWAVDVTDTGSGIPPEAQAHIFEPFRQVDESLSREYTGAGLGLSIVKQLTELMGGSVLLKSEVGQGSTFTVMLPMTTANENASMGGQ